MSYSQGMLKTSHISDANRMKRVVDENVYEPDSVLNPFLFLANLNNEGAGGPEYESMYRESVARQDLVSAAGATADALTIPVDHASMWRVYDTAVNVRTREMVFVIGVDTVAGTISVPARGLGNAGAAAAMVDNDVLALCGSAAPEGDTRLAAIHSQPSFLTNYTQIHKQTHMISNTDLATPAYGPNQLAESKDICERQYWMEAERCCVWGGKHKIQEGQDVIRFTGGLIPSLGSGSHVTNQSGTLSKAQLDAYLRPLFDYGNPEGVKIALCNSFMAMVMAALCEGYIRRTEDMKSFGWQVTEYDHPGGGKLKMQHYKSLSRIISASGAMIVIDPNLIGTRTLRATKYHTAGTDSNLVDGVIGEFIGEFGMQVKGITDDTAAHGFLYGVTGAAE